MKHSNLVVLSIGVASLLASCGGGTTTKNVKVMKNIDLLSDAYAYAVKKGNSAMLSSVNSALASINVTSIINSYFEGTATFSYTNPSVSPAPKAGSENYFVVATSPDFPPFENLEGEKLVGIDIEIANEIAKSMGKTLYVNQMDFDSVLPSVETGNSDVGMAGLSVTEDRVKNFDFSTEYYTSAQVITVLEDNTEFDSCKTAEEVETILKGKTSSYKIGTQKATTGFYYCSDNEDFHFETKAYDNGALAMKDLQNSKIDAVVIDKQPAIMMAASLNK